jgi:hypothetical protein
MRYTHIFIFMIIIGIVMAAPPFPPVGWVEGIKNVIGNVIYYGRVAIPAVQAGYKAGDLMTEKEGRSSLSWWHGLGGLLILVGVAGMASAA